MLVGNDVVDLRAGEGRRKADHARFVQRVFAPAEAALIRGAADPDVMLWLLWSAKEAAYKIARKLERRVVFAHRHFEVRPDADARSAEAPLAESWEGTGRVLLNESLGLDMIDVLPVTWQATASRVHCVATYRPRGTAELHARVAALEDVDADVLTVRESDCVRSDASAMVRRLTKQLARESGLGDVEIVRERVGGRLEPPQLHRVGAHRPIGDWDVSLSHDGRFVAVAIGRSVEPAPEV